MSIIFISENFECMYLLGTQCVTHIIHIYNALTNAQHIFSMPRQFFLIPNSTLFFFTILNRKLHVLNYTYFIA